MPRTVQLVPAQIVDENEHYVRAPLCRKHRQRGAGGYQPASRKVGIPLGHPSEFIQIRIFAEVNGRVEARSPLNVFPDWTQRCHAYPVAPPRGQEKALTCYLARFSVNSRA
jgi:hypothetical protein